MPSVNCSQGCRLLRTTHKIRSIVGQLVVVLLFLQASPITPTSQPETSTSALHRLSRAHLEFALSLFREVTQSEGSDPLSNILLSPYSVATVLSQLWLGSGEDSLTFRELEKTLHYAERGLSPEKVHQLFHSSLSNSVGGDPDFEGVVKQANGLFLQSGIDAEESYLNELKSYYNSSVQALDFANASEAATNQVNAWVAERTNGMIANLLDSPISPQTKFMVVNALALNAFWKHSFDKTRTDFNGMFYQDATHRIEIPMMAGKFKVALGASRALGCRLLELPFRGQRLSMFIILPDGEPSPTNEGLVGLERNFTAHNLKRLFSSMREESVHIRMPRFRLEETTRLSETLIKLGLTNLLFPSQANFSKISKQEEFSVSSLAHSVKLEMTETGVEAAAATAVGIDRFGETGEFFEINKPFLFIIWDYYSGALLFIGRVASPIPLPAS